MRDLKEKEQENKVHVDEEGFLGSCLHLFLLVVCDYALCKDGSYIVEAKANLALRYWIGIGHGQEISLIFIYILLGHCQYQAGKWSPNNFLSIILGK